MKLAILGTGTGVGKTYVTATLAERSRQQGRVVTALKPIETGVVNGHAVDAELIAEAAGHPPISEGFYRHELPLSPFAIELEVGARLNEVAVMKALRSWLSLSQDVLVEGAGGVLVPFGRGTLAADFFQRLGLPVLLVAQNRLGVQSEVLCALEALGARRCQVWGICLNEMGTDRSTVSNQRVLRELLSVPVWTLPNLLENW